MSQLEKVVVILVGIMVIGVGISGIYLVTIPSIFGIGEGAADIVNGEDVGAGLSNIIVSGLLLYITTGLFIAVTAVGVVIIFVGVVDN